MGRFTVAAAAVAAVIMLAGCSGAITARTGTGTGTKPTTIKTWRTAGPLTGPAPVGYWWCVDDFERLRTSNNSRGRPHFADYSTGDSPGCNVPPNP